MTENGRIREDGRMVHDMYLMQVKTPAESKAPWDYYTVGATLPGDEVYTKLGQIDYAAEIAQIRAAKPDARQADRPGFLGRRRRDPGRGRPHAGHVQHRAMGA
ncbi:hypothetical protein G6F40_017048 [Rhizopus arrhizus]|nr:hypothetical protein G6F40_017048 [Rhizopus arrhizus]